MALEADPSYKSAPMLEVARRAAKAAGEIILDGARRRDSLVVELKESNDFVTAVDRAAERAILDVILASFPEHAILAEESGAQSRVSDHVWTIDPLDGTTNFIHGIPQFCVSIACTYRGVLEHGVVWDPLKHEEFVASRGQGACLNGKALRVSERPSLDGALIGTGVPFKSRYDALLPAYAGSLAAVAQKTAGIRRAGSAALDLAYVAAGRLDGFWEVGLSPWDIAAGVLLVREAGGIVTDLDGGCDTLLERGDLVCGGPGCFLPLLETVAPFLRDPWARATGSRIVDAERLGDTLAEWAR